MNARREKKVGHINVHLPDRTELQVRRLAEAEGLSASEYLHRIIIDHLESKFVDYRLLRAVFDGDGSVSSNSSGGSL